MTYVNKISFLFLILFFNNVYSNDEPVNFNNKQLEQRYLSLIEETRCLVCQNQSLADSHADLAQDLRYEIYNMVVSGKTDEQIIQFLVDRYGDFVLYRPPLKGNTLLLWFGPFLFLIIGLIAAIIIIKKQSGINSKNIDDELNEEQKKRLTELITPSSAGDDK